MKNEELEKELNKYGKKELISAYITLQGSIKANTLLFILWQNKLKALEEDFQNKELKEKLAYEEYVKYKEELELKYGSEKSTKITHAEYSKLFCLFKTFKICNSAMNKAHEVLAKHLTGGEN